jgi:asparagine synthase (glutamine-hydrolysing)
MVHSVEVRPPFLDHRLAEFAATLPGSMKIRGGRVKHVLKEAVKDLLPADLLSRPKEGFIMPINEWLLGKLKSYVLATLAPKRLMRHGLFRPAAIQGVLDEHYSGVANRGNQIWNLLMFQLWWERYVE